MAEERISRDHLFATIIQAVSQRSTCTRARVGAILVKNNRVISTGYNGSPSGTPHCTEAGCILNSEGACIRTVHAEANLIAFAAKNGENTDGASLYTTLAPCLDCAKLIVNAGIKKVYFQVPYRNTDGLDLLSDSGIEVYSLVVVLKTW